MPDFTYEDRKRLERAAGELIKANRKIIQIAVLGKVVVGLRNDGSLYKYNFETKKWKEA